jgi:GTPase SAR1 family protein
MVELIEYENAEDDDMWKPILSSAEAAVFMYSISSKASLASAQDMWQKAKATKEEMGTWEPFQFCFLGNKADLEDEREVSREEGEAAAKSMECAFRECSAKVRTNIDETVEELVQKILTYRDNERIRYEQMKAQAEKGKKKKERSPFKRLFSK